MVPARGDVLVAAEFKEKRVVAGPLPGVIIVIISGKFLYI